ncbi:MAG: dTMP kinase [Deltaproteobacteria bacterium]|nr:dTMP kinase [Deltaproteobacteria bacterium]MBW2171780.1 dTMP kinase [Deltaproteobacteria bacterium]MBW2259082.1 dTMP kinase [Deltaproteobacteria bacterium]
MFISFEGIEGSGKTTQVELLIGVLQAKGHECVATREPGATEIGLGIREILLDSAHSNMLPLTELLLYEADRAQHIHDVIKPALAAGKVVVSDRFSDATTVYQGYARGCDLGLIERIHQIVLSGLRPDLTLILDLPVETGLERAWQRIHSRSGDLPEDRFEKEALGFHERVRQGYLTLARNEPDRFRVIDASGNPQSAHKDIVKAVLHREGNEGR